MSIFQNNTNKPRRNETIKSVCRLIPLNNDAIEYDEHNRQPQIDSIRKKLKLITIFNQKKKRVDPGFDHPKYLLPKTGNLLSLLLTKSKPKHQVDTIIYQNPKVKVRQIQVPQAKQKRLFQQKSIKTQSEQTNLALGKIQKCNFQQKASQQNRFTIDLVLNGKNQKSLSSLNTQINFQNKKLIEGFKISKQLSNLRIKQHRGQIKELMNQTKNKIYQQPIDSKLPYKKQTFQSISQINQKDHKLQTCNSTHFQKINRKQPDVLYKTLNQFRIKKQHQLIRANAMSYSKLIEFVGLTNKLKQSKLEYPIQYKFYLSKGNNCDLVRKLLKKRKWVQTNKLQEANFVWSQRKQEKFIQIMGKYKFEPTQITKNKNICFQFICCCQEELEYCTCQYNKLFPANLASNYAIKKSGSNKSLYQINFLKQTQVHILKSDKEKVKIHNHFAFNHEIAYKKLLFQNLKKYYEEQQHNPFSYIPLTFKFDNLSNQDWHKYAENYDIIKKNKPDCLWIIKPGQNTNRGAGIKIKSDLEDIRSVVQETIRTNRSAIVQIYVMPLLYNRRKFDIRCYALATAVNQSFKAYWYQEGYIRTSSKIFNANNINNKFIHLTNDAVQKHCNQYGKHESGNKLSFGEISKYMEQHCRGLNFNKAIIPQIISLSRDAFLACYQKLHDSRKDFSFEIFGLDFLIDEQYKVWLIEVNRNPCLETSTRLLGQVIGQMLQNAFKLGLDSLLPPGADVIENQEANQKINKFRLIVDKKYQV